MIKQVCWLDSSNVPHLTLEQCQASELAALFPPVTDVHWTPEAIAARIVEKAAEIKNILTMRNSSHPRGRKANGATRSRKPKANATLPLLDGGKTKPA